MSVQCAFNPLLNRELHLEQAVPVKGMENCCDNKPNLIHIINVLRSQVLYVMK